MEEETQHSNFALRGVGCVQDVTGLGPPVPSSVGRPYGVEVVEVIHWSV